MKHLIVSLHDVHPGSLSRIREQVTFFEDLGVGSFSLLVVPQFHHLGATADDSALLEFLDEREAVGDDLVVHGHFHDRQDRTSGSFFWTRLYTSGEAEFLDLLDEEVRGRLQASARLWEERGWKRQGFIAPAWLMPRDQEALLSESGFTYTNRLKELIWLSSGQRLQSQSLCYSTRSWWRPRVSLWWNQHLFKKLRDTSLIRLSLHPNDLQFPEIRDQIRIFTELALAEDFRPLSYASYVSL